jgi:hypothetical protein
MRDFQDCLNIGAKDAKQILEILQMQGCVQQKDNADEYLTTASGEAVCGSKLPRMKRESVEEALSTITERIEAINRDLRAKFSIRKAVAFGDFLSKRTQVQAADVGVMTRRTPVSSNEDNDEEEQTFLKTDSSEESVRPRPALSAVDERAHSPQTPLRKWAVKNPHYG